MCVSYMNNHSIKIKEVFQRNFEKFAFFFQEIMLGESDIAVCGGAENMSMAPFAVRNIRFGTPLGTDLKVSKLYHDYIVDI